MPKDTLGLLGLEVWMLRFTYMSIYVYVVICFEIHKKPAATTGMAQEGFCCCYLFVWEQSGSLFPNHTAGFSQPPHY